MNTALQAAAEARASDARADEPAILVEHVGKLYQLYDRPQDRLKQMLFWRFGRTYGRAFWALRDISFTVARGEAVGIIGRNGSGKSTLLQIIAGTLSPTDGQARVNGRVAALLELGSGFNPEFTGRENVFLNGAILGFTRAEMEQRFDDIAAFADIGDFIDQPVKLYSSGMAVRLAFAVQALVPKDILIVDEALAVGDMFFQAKCLNRMKQLQDEGITMLFVSHDTTSVKSLCRKAVLLERGRMIEYDSAKKVVEKYFAIKVRGEQAVIGERDHPLVAADVSPPLDGGLAPSADFLKRSAFQRIQNGKAKFINVQLLDEAGKEIVEVDYDQEVTLRMVIDVCVDIPTVLGFGYHIRNFNGVDVVYSDSIIEDENITEPRAGERFVVDWTFRASLQHGNYTIAVVLSIPINLTLSQVDFCDFIPLALQFKMAPRPDSYLHGGVHWPNIVQIQRYEAR